MTPVQLIALLYYHYTSEDATIIMPESQLITVRNQLLHSELIVTVNPGTDQNGYTTTERGAKMVQMLTDTPLPERKWSDPRDRS